MEIVELDAAHPNTYKLTLKNVQETRGLTAMSVGGGMIEIVEMEGVKARLRAIAVRRWSLSQSRRPVVEFIKAIY